MVVDGDLTAALRALEAVARVRLSVDDSQGAVEERLLQSIVDATATLFDAEASSIAQIETDRRSPRISASRRRPGAGAIWPVRVEPTEGIAGFVFSTGQALALTDVASDPRFDREAAEHTGYVPRSVAAVPLLDDEGSVGVLQVLDKRGSPSFSLRDMELLAVFSRRAPRPSTATRCSAITGRLMARGAATARRPAPRPMRR